MERLRRGVMEFGACSSKAACGRSAGVTKNAFQIIALIKRKKSILQWGILRICPVVHFTNRSKRP